MNKMQDERVQYAKQKAYANCFFWCCILLTVLFLVKLLLTLVAGLTPLALLPEGAGLFSGLLSLVLLHALRGVFGKRDERLHQIEVQNLSIAVTVLMAVTCLTACILMLLGNNHGILAALAVSLVQYGYLGTLTKQGHLHQGKAMSFGQFCLLTAAVILLGCGFMALRLGGTKKLPLPAWIALILLLLLSCLGGWFLAQHLQKKSKQNADKKEDTAHAEE